MSDVPLPFSITVLVISFFGLAGNIRFFIGNCREKSVHKQLLVLMTALHIVLCLGKLVDSVREFMGVALTRSSCLESTGALYVCFSIAQSILYPFLGLEVLILVLDTQLYKKLRAWWFHVLIYSTFLFSGWCVNRSWNSEEDRSILICSSSNALVGEIGGLRSTVVMVNCYMVIGLYAILLGILFYRRRVQRSRYTAHIIRTTYILTIIFCCSWFLVGFLNSFTTPIAQLFNIPTSYVVMSANLPAFVTYSQTHYVYFFVSADNRKAFRRMGPIALFAPAARLSSAATRAGMSTTSNALVHRNAFRSR